MSDLKNTQVEDDLKLPQGTTLERPTQPEPGMIRYNTDTGETEYWDGVKWWPFGDANPEATGGTIVDTDIGGVPYRIHYFTEVGNSTFTVTKGGEVEYLIVAGGGGGSDLSAASSSKGGGGGAGGVLTGTTTVSTGNYTIIVGDGGAQVGTSNGVSTITGNNGRNSSALSFTAFGGGFGGRDSGGSGGSGGGAGENSGTGGAGTAGQGNRGGDAAPNNAQGPVGAGGGGAGSPGKSSDDGGDGGHGISTEISGTLQFYGGGAGGSIGGALTGAGKGGLGGGADGSESGSTPQEGTPNTGGGGASGTDVDSTFGAAGGSGIVVVRYRRNASTATQPNETRPSFQPFFYARDVRPIIVRDGLVLDLDAANPLSYSGTGTAWSNLGPSSYTATINGGASTVYESTYGGGFNYTKLGGTTTDWIQLPHASLPELGAAYTVEYWMSPTNNGTRYFNHNTVGGGNESIHQISGNIIRHYNSNTGAQSFANGEILQYTYTRFADGTGLSYKNGENPVSTTGLYDYTSTAIQGWVLNQEQDALLGGFNASQAALAIFYIVRTYNRPLTQNEIRQNFNALRGRYGI